MKSIFLSPQAPSVTLISDSTCPPGGKPILPLKLVMMVATVATLTSLGIAIFIGWQSGGPLVERVLRIVLIGVAVLFVHWLPSGWSALRGFTRFTACALWIIAIAVVLYGQAAFFMLSQQYVGDRRAAMVATPLELSTTNVSVGRSRTEIARDIAKVSAELARAQAARCVGECPSLKVKRTRLAANLTALEVEADEALRRQASEDRRLAQADRVEEQRQRLRADPVVLPVASWLGTTAHFLELVIALAHAVVLEGAAVLGWLLVAVASSRAASLSDQARVSSDHASNRETTVACREMESPERDAITSHQVTTVDNTGGLAVTEDDLLLQKIHGAVTSGQFKPTQAAIRTLLRCGQQKARDLNRQYFARHGSKGRQGDEAPTSGMAIPTVADG